MANTTLAPPGPIDPNSINSNQTWAEALLQALGDPETQNNIDFISAWEQTEGGAGSINFSVEHNPISASYSEPGSSSFNYDDIQSYPNFAEGLAAAVADITGVASSASPLYTGKTQTALAPKLQTDLRSGNVGYNQLASDIAVGNGRSSWAGTSSAAGGGTGDAPAILDILTGKSGGISTETVNTATGSALAGTPGAVTATPVSALSNSLTRIVIGIIAIMLLGIGVDQLFKGGNSPGQVVVQGIGNNAKRVGKAAKTGGEAAAVE